MIDDELFISLSQLRRVVEMAFATVRPLAMIPVNQREEVYEHFKQLALSEIAGTKWEPVQFQEIRYSADDKKEVEKTDDGPGEEAGVLAETGEGGEDN